MRRILTALGISIAMLQTSQADDAIHADLKVNAVDTAFERAAVGYGKAIAIFGMKCEEGRTASCTYHAQGRIQLAATGASENGPAESVTLVNTRGKESSADLDLFLALLLKTTEPEMTEKERNQVTSQLRKGVAAGFESVKGKNADYSVLDMQGRGVWITAAKAR